MITYRVYMVYEAHDVSYTYDSVRLALHFNTSVFMCMHVCSSHLIRADTISLMYVAITSMQSITSFNFVCPPSL